MDMKTDQGRIGIGTMWREKQRWFWIGALLTFLGIVVASAVLVYVLPRDYVGRVRIEVMRDSQSFEVFPENSTKSRREFEDHSVFMRNETLKVASKQTLYRVIEEMQLVKKWEAADSTADAFRMLLDKLKVEHIPGSSMIEITVFHTDPMGAAELANSIGKAYQTRRNRLETARRNNALDMLNAQESLQEQKVEDARQRMIELMEKFDIVDLSTNTNIVVGTDTTETASRDEVIEAGAAVLRGKVETSALQTRIDTVLNMSSEARIEWLHHTGELSDHGKHLFDEREKLRLKLAMTEPAIAGDVPTEEQAGLDNVRRRLDALDDALERLAAGHGAALARELEIAKRTLENLLAIEEEARDDMMHERKSYTQYVEARHAYELHSQVLAEMREALLREKVDLSLPRSPIEIHEIAEPDLEPVSARAEKAIVGAAITGLMWAIPGGLLFMYLAYAFSGGRAIEYIDEDDVPEALEVPVGAEPEESPY